MTPSLIVSGESIRELRYPTPKLLERIVVVTATSDMTREGFDRRSVRGVRETLFEISDLFRRFSHAQRRERLLIEND